MKVKLKPSFLNVDRAKELAEPAAEILTEAKLKTVKFGSEEKDVWECNLLLVEGDREVIWTINDKSLENLIDKWGDESSKWIGKQIELKIEKSSQGKEMVVAYPH